MRKNFKSRLPGALGEGGLSEGRICRLLVLSDFCRVQRVEGEEGRKTGSPGHLKPRVWNSEHLRNAGGQGKSSRALGLAAVRPWGARLSVSFLCFALHRRPALRKSIASQAYRSAVLLLPLAAAPQQCIPAAGPQRGPQDFPPLCAAPWLSGRRRDRERPSPVLSSAALTGTFGFLALDV